MNLKYGKFVVLSLLVIIAGVGCSKAGGAGGSNRPLMTQEEMEQNKQNANAKRPEVFEKK